MARAHAQHLHSLTEHLLSLRSDYVYMDKMLCLFALIPGKKKKKKDIFVL